MNSISQGLLAAAMIALLGSPAASADLSADELGQWVKDLAHDEFARRELATTTLREAGLPALDLVVAAAMGDDPEAVLRARKILVAYSDSFETDLVKATLAAVEKLKSSPEPRIAKRAVALLVPMTSAARNRSAAYLSDLGIKIEQDAKEVLKVRVTSEFKGEDKDLLHLLRFPELATLSCCGGKLADAAMEIVPRMPNLQKLYIGGTSVTGEGLVHLKKIASLEYLSLKSLEIGDTEAAHVATLTHLQHLGFDYTKVTDKALVHVAGLKELRTIWLNGATIKGPGLRNLEGLPKLNKVVLTRCPFGDDGMPFLAKLGGLEILYLSETNVTDAGIGELESLGKLQKLWIRDTAISDEAIPVLGKLDSLEKLYVKGSKITPEGIEKLKKLLPDCDVSTS